MEREEKRAHSWMSAGPPIIPWDPWSWRGPNLEFLSGRFLGVFWEFYPDFPQAPVDRQFLSGPGIRPSEISDMSWKMSAFTSEVHLQLQEVKCNIFCFSTDVWGNLGKRCQVQSENHSVLAHFVLFEFRVLSSRQVELRSVFNVWIGSLSTGHVWVYYWDK